jgi:outer membrane receptor protein involved in Fe transport
LLRGTVSDTQGAGVPGATVTAKNTGTGVERSSTTDKAGDYQIAALAVGTYRIEVRMQGFQPQVAAGVLVEVARTVVKNFQLAVGTMSEEMTVTSEAPSIENGTTSVGQVINQRTVQEIPLNGRHFVDLGLLIPGSVTPPANGFLTAPLRGQGSFGLNTAGNREDTVNFMINGVNLNDMVQNQITFQPSINTVQEFKVDNSTFSAEYGRNSGAIVNIATRSGSNQFHGEAFEFFRNQDLDARNFFAATKSPFKRNQFGANLGGPILKDKTFFFVSYEGTRQRQGLDINSGVLRDDQRALVVDPVSQKLLSLIPHANATGPSGEGRYLGSATAPVNIDQWTGDLSHSFSTSDRLHAYYAFQKDLRGEPTLQGNTIPGFGDTRQSHRQILTVNESHSFSPSLVNEARFGYNKIHITFSPNAQYNPVDYGMSTGITTALALPQISVGGLGLNFGGPGGFPQGRTDTSWVLADTVSYLSGRHSFKFGGEWRRFENVNFTSDPGTFSYASLADFYVGRGNAFSITLGDRPSDIVTQSLGVFAKDTLRVDSRLSLELGLRYDWIKAPTDSENRFVVFDAPTVSLIQVGTNGRNDVYSGKSSFLEPRVGAIWNLTSDGKTVVRAGYAYLVDQPVTNAVTGLTANPPLAVPLNIAGTVMLQSALATAAAAGIAPASINPDFGPAHTQSYNVNIQREIGNSMGLMVGYFGSQGRDLRIGRNLNQFVNGVRPYPRLSATSPILPGATVGNITEGTTLGESHYNSLWVSLNKRMAKGLQFNASYTLAKSTDTNSQNNSGVVGQDSTNIIESLGPSDFDVRHRFVINAIYELPFKGNRFAEGWQLGIITQLQSGSPLTILTNVNTFTGNATLRPDLSGSVTPTGSPNQWFSNASVCDPRTPATCTGNAAFTIPVSAAGVFHFGNMGRNAILGPGFSNTDFSVTKNMKLSGDVRLQFRAEAFDVFNHANFGNPGRTATPGSTSFGLITATRFPAGDSGSSRQLQFALKLLF